LFADSHSIVIGAGIFSLSYWMYKGLMTLGRLNNKQYFVQ
jgi:hypothetical protein